MSNKKWFAFSDEHGMYLFTTEEEAKEKAEFLIRDSQGIDAGWDESVESVCYGEIKAVATKENERPSDNPDFHYLCDYNLRGFE